MAVKSNSIDNSNDCLINYLRTQNIDDDVFNATSFTEISDQCKRRINSEKGLVFIIVHQTYEKKSEFSNQFDCFMESIKSDEDFINLLLKKKAIESIKLSWKTKLNPKNWFASKKRKALKSVEAQINAVDFENLFVCDYENKFEGLFELSVEQRNSSNNSCIKNYLRKFDTQADIEGTEIKNEVCDEEVNAVKTCVSTSLQGFYTHYKKNVRKCINASLKVENFVILVMKAKVSSPTAVKKAEEDRNVFVQSSMNLFKELLKKCTK